MSNRLSSDLLSFKWCQQSCRQLDKQCLIFGRILGETLPFCKKNSTRCTGVGFWLVNNLCPRGVIDQAHQRQTRSAIDLAIHPYSFITLSRTVSIDQSPVTPYLEHISTSIYCAQERPFDERYNILQRSCLKRVHNLTKIAHFLLAGGANLADFRHSGIKSVYLSLLEVSQAGIV